MTNTKLIKFPSDETCSDDGSLKTEEKNVFDREILNVEEAAIFLRVSTKSVYKHARYGALPHQRIGSKYIFLRSELIRFLKGE